jgi:hypothetical protein
MKNFQIDGIEREWHSNIILKTELILPKEMFYETKVSLFLNSSKEAKHWVSNLISKSPPTFIFAVLNDKNELWDFFQMWPFEIKFLTYSILLKASSFSPNLDKADFIFSEDD